MKIVTIPHESLRAEAELVTAVDKKILNFIQELEKTLKNKQNPQGVGLAAPQVDKNWAIFTTLLENDQGALIQRVFINPQLSDASDDLILGPNDDETQLEGCLSMPGLYGPVFRHEWAKFRFHAIEGTELVEKEEVFTDFAARVMQHEIDHLHGILFTDRALEDNLPVYKESKITKKLEEVDPELLSFF
ncbi:MAG: peptide deformylase [Candidatus Pacebacteria bacterium CG_4_9_14_3_um_filter_40_12]|nr:peptide deformylase [Candidatus Paceibacterota bacterium]PIR63293.1 MAG: peptide deformylase [Candidatus Pacebacteria bacterium CG10_big_fil_rev_8_21_14_0_10_40_26]PIZ79174.1 MAG: peptide deformylase [Candidatus Pacebacteria bacterium CG_4_10_14_0_2_um_filter_40_20]PJA68829.1 MAG: peptide deformylase [Candidatus Pacebacteria bacterium CG_4_9_14_3_um_filter_40_12]PJC42140.1 MAG: peptide deformylase [Candidatus Pacebacteria bacterium CG_4_9_14_0_2_um_filter_40_15]